MANYIGGDVSLAIGRSALYGITTKRLNEQVKRNAARFPENFMFRLSAQETGALNRSQIATGSQKHRNPRLPPFAFTEHGAIMTATVLNSPRAVEISLYVVRAFVQLREWISFNKELARRIDQLEARIEKKLTSHDEAIAAMLSAIRELMHPPHPSAAASASPPTSTGGNRTLDPGIMSKRPSEL